VPLKKTICLFILPPKGLPQIFGFFLGGVGFVNGSSLMLLDHTLKPVLVMICMLESCVINSEAQRLP
jgi:hypothetical protein